MESLLRDRIRAIGLDGDDTLWESEWAFVATTGRFGELVRRYADVEDLEARLLAIERRNVRLFGYGVKTYVLSLIEAAIELTDGRITPAEIRELLEAGKAMVTTPVELIDGVRTTVECLHTAGYRLLLVTKGDLIHQEGKVAQSGLARFFEAVEIVSEKDESTYSRLLARHGVPPEEFMMVGNSLRSDAVPVLGLGGFAAHIPHPLTWVHEIVARPHGVNGRLFELGSLSELPALLGLQAGNSRR